MSLFFLLKTGQVTLTYDLSVLSSSYTDQDNVDRAYKVVFLIRNTLDGTVDIDKNFEADIVDAAIYLTPPVGKNLWVRCTQNSGQAFNEGDAVGSWHSLTSSQARSFGLSFTSSGSPDLQGANIDLEIATDSGGTDIVATKAGIAITIGNTGP